MEKKLQGKDLMNVGIYTAIYFFVTFLVAMLGFIPIFMVLMVIIAPLIGGIPFMLFLTKVKKPGMIFIMSVIMGLLMLLTGMGYWPLIISIITGVAAELIYKAGQYKSAKSAVLAAGIFPLWMWGNYLPLDEPSANLDYEATQRLRKVIRTWQKVGKTILIAEHRIAWLWDLCDRVIIMDQGKIRHDFADAEKQQVTPEQCRNLGLRSFAAKDPQTIRKTCESSESDSVSRTLRWKLSSMLQRKRSATTLSWRCRRVMTLSSEKTVRDADQILVMDQGRIVQNGDHDSLIEEDGIYRNFICGRQQAVSWKL